MMLLLLSALSWAAGTTSEPRPMWLLDGAQPSQQSNDDPCVLAPKKTAKPLPVGVRMIVREYTGDGCKKPLLLATFEAESWPRTEGGHYWLDAKYLADKASSKNVWSTAAPVTAVPGKEDTTGPNQHVGGVNSQHKWVVAQSLDAPGHPITFFGNADRVTVLSLGHIAIVRHQGGGTFALPGQRVRGMRDPLSTKDDERNLRERLNAGRAGMEAKHPIALWPHEGLSTIKKHIGHVFAIDINPENLTVATYKPEWFDPVAHVQEGQCGNRKSPAEPCSTVYLDYRAFGAWWPDKKVTVLARLEGTQEVAGEQVPHLKVLVKHPWSDMIRVSPLWDGSQLD